MGLRLGVDLDGVLADMDTALAKQADTLFGPPDMDQSPASAPWTPRWADTALGAALAPRLTTAQRKQLWRKVRGLNGFWEGLNETEPGVVARLAALATTRGWEVIFLTRRPSTRGATAQVQSQRWLQAHGFPLPSVFIVNTSRGSVASALALDVVVDDKLENCLDVVNDSKATAIGIFRRGSGVDSSAHTRLGIHVVHSTGDCLRLLCDIDSRRKGRGAIERVLRRLGLKSV